MYLLNGLLRAVLNRDVCFQVGTDGYHNRYLVACMSVHDKVGLANLSGTADYEIRLKHRT